MRIIPSSSVVTNCAELEGLLRRYADIPPASGHFGQDWGRLWNELVAGGWLDLVEVDQGTDSLRKSLVDAAYVAERWARYLIPLPLTEALWLSLRGESSRPVPLPRERASVICYPAHFLSAGTSRQESNVDGFAPSRPVAIATEAPDPAAGTMVSLLCAEAVGCAAAALDLAVTYAGVREAYGKPIASYQALRHLLADAYIDVELARSAVLQAVYDGPSAPASVLTRARRAVSAAIQVHGGIGFTWEAGLHFYLRHVLAVERLVSDLVAAQPRAA
jgi:hypothetical protein